MKEWSEWALATRKTIKTDAKLNRLYRCFKRIMNSLPGKWCQHEAEWVDCPERNGFINEWHKEYARVPGDGPMTVFRTIAGQCQYLNKIVLADLASPAVAAFWTSYGRAALLGFISLLEADDLFYYHTDSLIVNVNGLQRIRDTVGISETGEPGRLRLIGKADHATFVGISKYCFGGEWKYAGGLPGEDEDILMSEQMWRARTGTPARARVPGRREEYKHGTVTEDGIVRPFIIGESNDQA
jgi:hypothetical protein